MSSAEDGWNAEGWKQAAIEYRSQQPAGYQTDAECIATLAGMSRLDYDRHRRSAAEQLGIKVDTLDKAVRDHRSQTEEDCAGLPHWKFEPSPDPVDGAALLNAIRRIFRRYIVLPQGADIALSLWVLHAWTMDAGEISPFMVLVSPTKRCGKTSVLILIYFLTPRSELAANITASSLFRYIEEVRPTLLIDEADSFIRDNEELRGILNSGHTKAAANIIRNVEINGEHKPRRFSTWAPKAIATIRPVADTLEDRSIIVQLQRKPPGAKVERLRRRDCEEFAVLRNRAARWAADSFGALRDPDPQTPRELNDRAADNWRPLLAIADIVGGTWPQDARRAACLLSGESQDGAIGVELLIDIHRALGEAEALRSADLVAKLTADPERPWAEWKHGRALTQKQLGGLLKPFGIVSETVSIPGFNDAKGYKRIRFEATWEAYCPGQSSSSAHSEILKRRNVEIPMERAQLGDSRNVAKGSGDGSKNGKLSHSHVGFDASTLWKAQNGGQGHPDQEIALPDDGLDIPDGLQRTGHRCDHCGSIFGAMKRWDWPGRPDGIWLHPRCEASWHDGRGA